MKFMMKGAVSGDTVEGASLADIARAGEFLAERAIGEHGNGIRKVSPLGIILE